MKDEKKLDVLALARAKWKSSGLSDLHAKRLQLRPLDRAQTGSLAPRFSLLAALKIPYFDLEGRPTKFYRVRRLEEPKGFDGLTGKFPRYAQPIGTPPEVYLPPLGQRSWRQILADPKLPVVVTEGELKAASACAHGFACLGLGGVDSWRSRKKGISLIPALADASWNGRLVTIAFDSDAATNPDVVRAAHGLGSELKFRGAEVCVAAVPPAKDGKKQGLDDLLVADGEGALRDVLDEAEALEEQQPMWKLNEEVVYVRDPGLIVVRATSQKMTPDAFVRHRYANRRHEVLDSDGKPKVLETAKEWMRWPHRAEVEKLTYAPGKPRQFGGLYNQWTGLGVEPLKGDVSPFVDLVDFVTDSLAKELKRWLWQWMAYPLQNPGAKLLTCVALWSPEQGVGKSLVAYCLKDIYGSNGVEIKNRDLDSSFNSYVENKQFVVGDEITGGDSRAFADQLKGLITQEEARINAKYVPEYVVPDCANWFFTSQQPDAFYLDDTDRRFFIHHVHSAPRKAGWYARIDKWRDKDNRGGARQLLAHLLDVDLTGFDPKAKAPSTPSKEAMQYQAKSELGRWISDLKNDPEKLLRVGDIPISKDLFTPNELLGIFDPTNSRGVKVNGMGRELVKAFPQLPKCATSSHGSQNLYAVRNAEKWKRASPAQRATHWEGTSAMPLEKRREERY